MPIYRCGNGKYRIGDGECMYTSHEHAVSAYVAYLAQEKGIKEPTYNDYPEAATNNAKRALKWKEEKGSDCGTAVGWTRARQLANRERISRDTIARMASFKRHQANKDVPYDEGCGGIMWDAWGGDAGIEWAIRKLRQIDSKGDSSKVSFDYDGTLSTESGKMIAEREINNNKDVYIISARESKDGMLGVADRLSIPESRVYATGSNEGKIQKIKDLNIGKHYDNNPDVIAKVNAETTAKGVLINKSMYLYKNLDLEVKDVDVKKGIVTGYFSAFNIKDSDGDIIRPGAFTRSIQDWGPEGKGRIKHLMNHNPSQPLGKIQVLKEDQYGLYYESKVGSHSLGQDYIKMIESDLIKEHSIGFTTLKEQKGENANELLDIKLYEGSSLTAWGANEYTPIVEMKGKNIESLNDRIKAFEKFVRHTDATDETIDLCILQIKQLTQLVEQLSTQATDEVLEQPEEQKSEEINNNIKNLFTEWKIKSLTR